MKDSFEFDGSTISVPVMDYLRKTAVRVVVEKGYKSGGGDLPSGVDPQLHIHVAAACGDHRAEELKGLQTRAARTLSR